MEDNIKEFVYGLNGTKLEGIYLAADMLEFCFDNAMNLHAQGFCRVIRDSDVLITTHDYQSWDGENDTNNDEWFNTQKYKDELIGGVVKSVEISPVNDLKVALDNGVTIECIIWNAYPHYEEELEQWVLFDGRDTKKSELGFLTVYNKHVSYNIRSKEELRELDELIEKVKAGRKSSV